MGSLQYSDVYLRTTRVNGQIGGFGVFFRMGQASMQHTAIFAGGWEVGKIDCARNKTASNCRRLPNLPMSRSSASGGKEFWREAGESGVE